MKFSELTDQELVSAIERHTGFRFRGMPWCVQANTVPRHSDPEDPDGFAIGITYWGDATSPAGHSPEAMALSVLDALAAARVNMASDGVASMASLAVFVGRAALERVHASLLQPGGSASIGSATLKETRNGR